MSKELPLYVIVEVFVKGNSKGFAIEKPDGSYVNEYIHPRKEYAQNHLDTLYAFGHCRKE